MSDPTTLPRKTELGIDELRRRTRGLGQRHRTMLLLVNGKRERREVLTLARQAGVDSVFFDELVAMGLVDPGTARPATRVASSPMPLHSTAPAPLQAATPPRTAPRPPAAPTPPPAKTPPSFGAEPPMLSEAVVAQPRPAAADEAPPSAARVKFTSAVHQPRPPARKSAPVEVRRSQPSDLPPRAASTARAAPRAPIEPTLAPRKSAAAPALRKEPVLTPADPPARRAAIRMPAPAVPPDEAAEQQLLTEVRQHLVASLVVDGLITSSLLALRVRKARSRNDLTALVWEIERNLARSRHPPEARWRLMEARELLGLGNTLVHDDSRPDRSREP